MPERTVFTGSQGRCRPDCGPMRRGWRPLAVQSSGAAHWLRAQWRRDGPPRRDNALENGKPMNSLRRLLLKGASASAALLAAIGAGALRPRLVLAADWNAAAFEAKTLTAAMRGMGIVNPQESGEVVLSAPDIAEDGKVVPIEVASKLPGTQSLSVFIDRNPSPLAAHFDLSGGALPSIGLRVKMAQTSIVRVVAQVDGRFYFTAREIQVTEGGCAA